MSSQEQRDPTKRLPPIDESLVINTRFNEIERRQREQEAEEREYKRRQLRFNLLLVVFTALLFLTSAVSDWLLLRQAIASRESADAATAAAKSATDTLTHNKEAVTASLSQGKAALDSSIESSHLDQRAWLGVTEVAVDKDIKEGSTLRFVPILVNSGKTPALNVLQRGGWLLLPKTVIPNIEQVVEEKSAFRHGVIQPGARRELSNRLGRPLLKEQAEGLMNGSMVLYVFSSGLI